MEDINSNYQWWEDQKFVATLLKDANEIKHGKQKVFSLAEVKESIILLPKK